MSLLICNHGEMKVHLYVVKSMLRCSLQLQPSALFLYYTDAYTIVQNDGGGRKNVLGGTPSIRRGSGIF